MANILALVPMNAANFDSGNADSGEVLTADGGGGASWQVAVSEGSTNFGFPVLVTRNWISPYPHTNAAQAAALDITDATGITFSSSGSRSKNFILWRGPSFPDDFASLKVDETGGGYSWIDEKSEVVYFVYPPAVGDTVFIVGLHVTSQY